MTAANNSSVLASLLADFAGRDGNEIMQAQASLKAPVWRELGKEDVEGKVGVINIVTTDDVGSTHVDDMGTRPDGGARIPVQGIMQPVYSTTTLVVGHGAKYQNKGAKDAANWLAGEVNVKSDSLAKLIDTSLLCGATGLICTASAIVSQFSSGVAVFTFPTVNGLRNNTAVELGDDGYGKTWLVRVGKIVPNGNSYDVSLHNDVYGADALSHNTNAVLAGINFQPSTAKLYVRGSRTNVGNNGTSAARNIGPIGLQSLAGTGSIYGISADDCIQYGFLGQTFGSVGDVSHEKVSARIAIANEATGDMPNLAICSQRQAVALGFGALTPSTGVGAFRNGESVGVTQKVISGKLDKYGNSLFEDSGVAVSGIRLLKDANCPADTMFLLDKNFVKVGLWHDIELEKDDGGGEHLSQTKLQSQLNFTCMYNLMCRKRSSVIMLSGLEAGFLA